MNTILMVTIKIIIPMITYNVTCISIPNTAAECSRPPSALADRAMAQLQPIYHEITYHHNHGHLGSVP